MKKLIIAAAIVCAAAMSQAAAFQWMSVGINGVDDKPYSGSAILTLWDNTAGGSATYGATMTAGNIMTVIGDNSAADAGFIKAGNVYSAQFTMTDTAGNVYTSAKATNLTALYPSSNMMMLGGGSWQTVPEPTSGLLLLLGVAGLALKRKRA